MVTILLAHRCGLPIQPFIARKICWPSQSVKKRYNIRPVNMPHTVGIHGWKFRFVLDPIRRLVGRTNYEALRSFRLL